VTTRTLVREIVMRTSEQIVFDAVRFLECTPEIIPNSTERSVFTIEPFRRLYRIREPGADDTDVLGHRAVVDHLHARLLSFSLQARPRAAILHAACLRRGDRRVLIAGHQAAGKTTLALRLVQADYELEGDEHVFVEDDGVIARPRACRIKETSLTLLPNSAAIVASSPVYADYLGRRVFNVDPRLLGASCWRIEKGPVHCIIVLQPNHGGFSSIRPMPPLALSQALISEFGLREAGRSISIGAIAKLASTSKGYDLSLGDHESAIRCINRALDACTGSRS
jgi:hypothetical protein